MRRHLHLLRVTLARFRLEGTHLVRCQSVRRCPNQFLLVGHLRTHLALLPCSPWTAVGSVGPYIHSLLMSIFILAPSPSRLIRTPGPSRALGPLTYSFTVNVSVTPHNKAPQTLRNANDYLPKMLATLGSVSKLETMVARRVRMKGPRNPHVDPCPRISVLS